MVENSGFQREFPMKIWKIGPVFHVFNNPIVENVENWKITFRII